MHNLLKRMTQTITALLMVFLVGTQIGMAQVAVTVGDLAGRPGETVAIPVTLSNVENEAGIRSYGFTVTSDAGVNFVGHSTDGTLSSDAGFLVISSPGGLDRVGGSWQGTTEITESGTLVYLLFELTGADGTTGTVTLTGFELNDGNPAVTGTFTSDFTIANRFIVVNDATAGTGQSFEIDVVIEDPLETADGVISFTFDLDYDPALMTVNGISVTGGIAAQFTNVAGNGQDADTYRVAGAGVADGAAEGEGLLVKVLATAGSTAGSAPLTLRNVEFNDGTPVYAATNGTLTISPFNFAPVFTAELTDTEILEDDDVFTFDYDATDANGDPIVFSLDGPGSIDATTGVYTIDPEGNSGVHTITVGASDGVNTTFTSADLTIVRVDFLYANLAGFHEVPPAATVGSGFFIARLVAEQGTLEVSGGFEDLGGSFTASHIHLAGVGANGGILFPLSPVDGEFDETIDVSGASASEISALRNGGTYVNVHSTAYPAGELRGQLLNLDNEAPNAATLNAPSEVVISGDPNEDILTVSWLPVSDPDGDEVQYIWQVSTNAAFTDVIGLEPMGTSNSFSVTAGDLAEVFDEVSGGSPGSIDIGGTVTLFHRVISTDGSLWTAGSTKELALVRGTVTDTEQDGSLPTEFSLRGNYPNPFAATTTIQFDLPETSEVRLQVMDMLGREVLSVPTQTIDAGAQRSIVVNGDGLSSGIYLYRVVANGRNATAVKTGKMTLLK